MRRLARNDNNADEAISGGLRNGEGVEHAASRAARARRVRRARRGHEPAARQGRAAHPVARARIRAQEFHRRRCQRPAQSQARGADRPAAPADALQLARSVRRHHGGRLPDAAAGPEAGRRRAVRHLEARGAALDLAVRLLGPAFARRASGLVRRWRDRAFLRRRRRLHAAQSQGRPVLSRDRRAEPVEAARDLPLVDAGHRARATTSRRRRAIRNSTAASAPTTPTSIPSGRTAPISPISTAACGSSTSPTRRGPSRSGTGTRIRPSPASRTRRCRSSTATSWW